MLSFHKKNIKQYLKLLSPQNMIIFLQSHAFSFDAMRFQEVEKPQNFSDFSFKEVDLPFDEETFDFKLSETENLDKIQLN